MDSYSDNPGNRAFINSLAIAFLYVGLGTIAVICVYPPWYSGWVDIALLVTLPVTIISFGIMYADPDGYLLVLTIQAIIFLLCWGWVYKLLLNRYKRQTR